MSEIKTVTVDPGSRRYDISIGRGLLPRAAQFIAPHLKSGRCAIITDAIVAGLHLDVLTKALGDAGIETHVHILPAGEATKSFDHLQSLMSDLLNDRLDRGDSLIALGGGVIGDLTGFAASIYKRGCGFIQIPTTLLAQVDSSVGGKTGINAPQGKNLIGAFYQPSHVLIDTDVLSTLPERQIKAGYAEVLKYGLLGDAEFFDWLEENGEAVLALEPQAITHAIAKSCKAKATVVSEDEFERGRRALLNLGHTFAHALEAEAGYGGALLHGEAVSAGMAMAFDYSAARGICPQADADRVKAHLTRLKLTQFTDLSPEIQASPERHMGHMAQDKKNSGGNLTLILARAIGEAFIERKADTKAVTAFWAAQINKAGKKSTTKIESA